MVSPMLLLLLRLVHIVGGALWVGMAVYTAAFLVPAVEEAGPDGGKVMAALQRRGIMTVLPALALATLLSGFWLYWRAAGGQPGVFGRSGPGIGFGVGAVVSLAAYAIGMLVMRPSMLRAATLMAGIGPADSEAERTARLAEARRLRSRGAAAGRMVAALLLLAVGAMAVARYL